MRAHIVEILKVRREIVDRSVQRCGNNVAFGRCRFTDGESWSGNDDPSRNLNVDCVNLRGRRETTVALVRRCVVSRE